jgi:hypothetical protein
VLCGQTESKRLRPLIPRAGKWPRVTKNYSK